MFNAAEFRLIRTNCLPQMETLLQNLSIAKPNWNMGDEYRLYEQLDEEITRNICRLMKSSSIIDGYSYLLKLGNISYDFSETDKELLGKIVSNKDKIIQSAEKASKIPILETPKAPPAKPVQQSSMRVDSQSATKTVVKEEVETLTGPIILGLVLVIIGAIAVFNSDSKNIIIIGKILMILGVISAGIGIKGKKIAVTKTVPNNSANNQLAIQPTIKQPTTNVPDKQVKKQITFTRKEITDLINILDQINKILHAI